MTIKIEYDNDKTTVWEGRKIISRGTDPLVYRFAKNVERSETLQDWVRYDSVNGHIETIIFREK